MIIIIIDYSMKVYGKAETVNWPPTIQVDVTIITKYLVLKLIINTSMIEKHNMA